MSACDHVQPLLADWIAGELDAGDAAGIRSHLAECASCRAEEAEMRTVLALFETDVAAEGLGGGVRDPGAAYWATFADRVEARTAKRAGGSVFQLFGRTPRFIAAGLAAAAVLVVALTTPTVAPVETVEDPRMAELLVESVGLSPGNDFGSLEADDLDRLGDELATATRATPVPAPAPAARDIGAARFPFGTLDELDELSPAQLETLLERLDAFET